MAIHARKDYSQRGEQRAVIAALARLGVTRGKFLDIGAADGLTFSNTAALAEAGWGGMLVEASPSGFTALARRYGARPDLQLVCAAVATNDNALARLRGLVELHLTDDLVSTTEPEHFERWRGAGGYYATALVQPITVANVLRHFNRGPDEPWVLSIDTEGSSVPLFEDIPAAHGPAVAVVEHDNMQDRVLAHAAKLGLAPVFESGENLVLARPE